MTAPRSHGPRLHRLRRPERLASARHWIDSGARPAGQSMVRTYAKRYGVDRYSAHDELTTLGVALGARDARWASRPPPLPKQRARLGAPEPGEWPPPGWIEFGGELMFPVGWTSGGWPYGLRASDLDDDEGSAVFGPHWEALRRRATWA